VVLEIAAGDGPRWLVGPDNGLLVPAADAAGGPLAAWSLPPATSAAVTFDGRDVFAPAAGRLAAGDDPAALGQPLSPDRLVRLSAPLSACSAGRVHASVTWVDRFGNVQLAARGAAGPAPGTGLAVGIEGRPSHRARRVRAFADLAPGELGVLDDADGQLAVVCWRASAAALLGVVAGDVVTLSW
jgi:S-adenosylmethionine hydrolase